MVGYNILPIGFSSYEKSTIETFFRLAGRRAPHWGLTTRSNEARVVLFNATSQQDIESFRSLVASWQKVIIVGSSDFGTGWSVLPRPIKLTAILSLLDASIQVEVKKDDVFLTQAAPAASFTAAAEFVAPTAPIIPVQVSVPINATPSFTPNESASHVVRTNAQPDSSSTSNSALLGRVLLVDDSDVALKYMQNRLRYFGYECDLSHNGEEALTLVAKNNYKFVFLDVMMTGLDGYQTCKAIKNNRARGGAKPVVVMLTSRSGTIDKIRGTMAGCDAYLTKPLNDKRLSVVLGKFDGSTVAQRWEANNPREPLVDTYALRQRSVHQLR
jgi:two-component system, cell cycle response regulator